jgi:P27 family predicted phage terminase small subunit
MMVAVHSVPTKLKILRGNPGNHPIRPEPEPRVPETVPEPPECLGPDAADEWRRLAPELHVIGLLTVADVQLFALYCEAYGAWRDAGRTWAHDGRVIVVEAANGNLMKNPALAAVREAARDMLYVAREFGLTPAARCKLSAPNAPKAGKFDGFVS